MSKYQEGDRVVKTMGARVEGTIILPLPTTGKKLNVRWSNGDQECVQVGDVIKVEGHHEHL